MADKKVSIFWLSECIYCERYNLIYVDNELATNRLLTQSEFDLLKEVLGKWQIEKI